MEPGGDQWNFYRIDPENCQIRITSYENLFEHSNPKLIVNEFCKTKDFLYLVLQVLDKLIKKHGIIGYKNTWINYEFPFSSYIKIKKYFTNDKILSVELVEEQGRTEFYKSNLSEELAFIISI